MPESQIIDQYFVQAERATGNWISEPHFVQQIDAAEWAMMKNTDLADFGTYEAGGVTRAIEIHYLQDQEEA